MAKNTQCILAKKIKLDKSYRNVLDYTDTLMIDLLLSQSHLVYQSTNCSYIRELGAVILDCTMAQALQSNYIAFKNPDYENKWFFGFIDKVEYVGNKATKIFYSLDVWSTWFDKWTASNCFVVRETVEDDTIGKHTIDENLDVGEVISTWSTKAFDTEENFYVAIASTHNPIGTGSDFTGISMYNKNIFGYQIFLFKIDLDNLTNSVAPIIHFLEDTASHKSDLSCISDMFIVPMELIPITDLIESDDFYGSHFYTLKYRADANYRSIFIPPADTTPTGFYEPKNNKCYCYPYNFLYVTNNSGNDNIYRYEDFELVESQGIGQLMFGVKGAMSIGYNAMLTPYNYRKVDENYNESLPLGKYPVCGWASDSYTNWLTQNSVNMPLKILGILTGATSSLASGSGAIQTPAVQDGPITRYDGAGAGVGITGAGVGAGINVATGILSVIGDFKNAKLLPNVSHGANNGNINFSDNKLNFTFYQMRAKDEYMKSIDNYFTMFGYKVNELKTPTLKNRTHWDYVEIAQGEKIGYGDVPSNYMDIINSIASKGVTIWHHHNEIGNYSLDNTTR